MRQQNNPRQHQRRAGAPNNRPLSIWQYARRRRQRANMNGMTGGKCVQPFAGKRNASPMTAHGAPIRTLLIEHGLEPMPQCRRDNRRGRPERDELVRQDARLFGDRPITGIGLGHLIAILTADDNSPRRGRSRIQIIFCCLPRSVHRPSRYSVVAARSQWPNSMKSCECSNEQWWA